MATLDAGDAPEKLKALLTKLREPDRPRLFLLDDIDHGKAPSGELCVKALVKVCVSKDAPQKCYTVPRHYNRLLPILMLTP